MSPAQRALITYTPNFTFDGDIPARREVSSPPPMAKIWFQNTERCKTKYVIKATNSRTKMGTGIFPKLLVQKVNCSPKAEIGRPCGLTLVYRNLTRPSSS